MATWAPSSPTRWVARRSKLVGIHLNLLPAVLAIADQLPTESEQERAALEAFKTFQTSGFGYFLEMATRPQTIGYALLDSPVALAAWLLDHDTDSYYKISRAFVDGDRRAISPRRHRRQHHAVLADGHRGLGGQVVLGGAHERWPRRLRAARLLRRSPCRSASTFPGEIWADPASWVEAVYPGLAYFNEVDKGGHFAAWEERNSSQERSERRLAHCVDRRTRAARTVPENGRSVLAAIPERKAKRWRKVRSCRRSRTSRRRGRACTREGSHRASGRPPEARGDRPRFRRAVGPRRRELAGEYVRLEEDFLDRYVVSPGDDAPEDYTWAR